MKYENPHIILDGDASLTRHHNAKIQIRHTQLDRIPLKRNDKVLDIGIGPGLYLKYWLESTRDLQPRFDLFDASDDALRKSSKIAEDIGLSNQVRTIKGDLFSDLSKLELGSYDVIFIGNTIEYVSNPAEFIKNHILPLIKKGGLLVIRDLDCSFMSCNTVDQAMNARIVESRIQNNAYNSRKDPKNYQNPFIGKNLESIFIAASLEVISVYHDTIEFNGPITGAAREYL